MSVLFVPQVQQLLIISLAVMVNMASKRDASKETTDSSTEEVVEKTLLDLPVYGDTQLFIEKGKTMTWK